jgi:predicted ribonuclease YlaK
VLIDEAQLMSQMTVKLLLERCGTNTKYIIMGDAAQCYAVTKRGNGFSDLIEKTTDYYQDELESKYDQVGYIRMTADDNQRSSGSKFVNRLYED